MAKKKKETELTALQMPVPSGAKVTSTLRADWTGLNLRQTTDTGELSMERNISTAETPYLTPSQSRSSLDRYEADTAKKPIGLFGFEDFLLYVYHKDKKILIDYIKKDGTTYTGTLQDRIDAAGCENTVPRQIVKFNVYEYNNTNGGYTYKLLIFPDRKSMDFIVNKNFEPQDIETGWEDKVQILYRNEDYPYYPDGKYSSNNNDVYEPDTKNGEDIPKTKDEKECYYWNIFNNRFFEWDAKAEKWIGCVPYGFPKLKYVTVHLSRLFGVDDDNVYASGFNDYANWDLDTADDFNDAHAWMSAAQSNTKANGAFTGIFTYQNHVVLFKDDFMHELTNTKNPFRINDIFAEGTFDARTIQDVDGKLIFVSRDGVKAYTGGNPKIIGYNLNADRFSHAVSGTDNRRYYLYCNADNENRLFVYDTYFDRWAEESLKDADGNDFGITAFANNKNGMYMLTDGGKILKMDTGEYEHDWAFETEFFLGQTINIKHIRKLQLLADIPTDSTLKLYLLYDGEEFDEQDSHLVYDSTSMRESRYRNAARGKKGCNIPIRIVLKKTANFGFKLHAEGYGYVRLHQLEIHLTAGGEETM